LCFLLNISLISLIEVWFVNKEATRLSVPSGKIEMIMLNVFRLPS
jgi:hypothetical protein